MKNIIISALIAAFFGSKSTKDIQEKTKNASWFRTFLYLFLSVIFGVFFYKSYQVRTIINQIDINSLRAFEDSLHHPIDTIKRRSSILPWMLPCDNYPNMVHRRYMKKGMSARPCTCALNPLIFELSDSAEAFECLSLK